MKTASMLIASFLALAADATITRRLHHAHTGTSSLTSIRAGGSTDLLSLPVAGIPTSTKQISKAAAVQKDSSDSGTETVDQDGHDIAYFFDVILGSDNQNFSLVVDTGSYYTWVYGINCTANACTSHHQYDPSKSSQSVNTNEAFSIEYTQGDISGTFYSDRAQFAGFDTTIEFGVANQAGDIFESFPIDGILGMSAKDKDGQTNPGILRTLKNQGLVDDMVFGVNLGRAADPKDEGSITFGGTDTTKYTGDISYTNVTGGSSLLWILPMSNTFHGDIEMDFGGARSAIIDTGSTLITVPTADAEKFHSYFEGAVGDGNGNYVVPCNASVPLIIQFSGVNWTIPSEDYISSPVNNDNSLCSSLVQGLNIPGNSPSEWLLGDVFLKNVYSVFDIDNQQVGFAKKVSGPTENTPADAFILSSAQSSSPSSTSSSSSTLSVSASSSPQSSIPSSQSTGNPGSASPANTTSSKASPTHTASSNGALALIPTTMSTLLLSLTTLFILA